MDGMSRVLRATAVLLALFVAAGCSGHSKAGTTAPTRTPVTSAERVAFQRYCQRTDAYLSSLEALFGTLQTGPVQAHEEQAKALVNEMLGMGIALTSPPPQQLARTHHRLVTAIVGDLKAMARNLNHGRIIAPQLVSLGKAIKQWQSEVARVAAQLGVPVPRASPSIHYL
jgi:hypothetical protein